MRRLLPALLSCACVCAALAQQPPTAPPASPDGRAQLRAGALGAGRAALASGQAAEARRHAARVLWELEPSAEDARAARLLVIDSYIAEKQGEAAFGAMLRYQQDYAPLDRATASHFVEALLALNLERQAVNWLASLDDASPVKLMLRLKAGLIAPESVVAQARAELAKGGATTYWGVVAEAAQRRNDFVLRIEALEHLLDAGDETGRRAAAADLWRTYVAAAQDAANRTHLLTGDDAAWADYAARQLGARPQLARALYGYLAQRGRERATRENGQLQLAYSLSQSQLDRAGLWLFDGGLSDGGASNEVAPDEQTRYVLGAMAERADLPALVVRYWKGLAAPPGVSAEEWQARAAAVHWRNGTSDAALALLRQLLAPGRTLAPETARRVIALAQEMVAAGRPDQADGVLKALLPVTEPRQSREVLYALGRIAEGATRFDLAADYYLRAATAAGGKPDALAVQARLAAAHSLAQAGQRDDARTQLQWLVKNAPEPSQRDIARRELSKL